MANCFPIHALCPTPNGKKANEFGLKNWVKAHKRHSIIENTYFSFSWLKRSGLKVSGSLKCAESCDIM